MPDIKTDIRTPDTLTLRALRVDDEAEALAAQRELADEGFEFLPQRRPEEPWSQFVLRVQSQRDGLGLPTDYVPSTFLVADVGGRLVGRVSIRHRLNQKLRLEGGHIGYAVHPDSRRRGYGTEMLRQALALCEGLGIDRVLVTCNDDNVGSARVIERNSGVLREVVPDPTDQAKLHRHYWIGVSRGNPKL